MEDLMSPATASAARLALGRHRLRLGRPPGRLEAQAALAAVSFAAYVAGHLLEGGASTVFSLLGVGACGWAWLLARALFDPAAREAGWAKVVALVVAASGAASVLAPADGLASRLADNTYVLSGSAALLLTFVEPFHRYSADLPRAEKRFRLAFVGVYAAMVALSVMGLTADGHGPADALRQDLIKSACALVGLPAVPALVRYRQRHPNAAPTARPPRRPPTAEDVALAERLRRLLAEEAIDLEADLKIADVAARLREPEYRVSQSISTALGFPNFNRWINHHRIARAKQMLDRADERRSILEIAFACGFGSLGPFNRAFRDEVGTTPRSYRAARRTDRP
jgi:AraC-like DNA-binding protein